MSKKLKKLRIDSVRKMSKMRNIFVENIVKNQKNMEYMAIDHNVRNIEKTYGTDGKCTCGN